MFGLGARQPHHFNPRTLSGGTTHSFSLILKPSRKFQSTRPVLAQLDREARRRVFVEISINVSRGMRDAAVPVIVLYACVISIHSPLRRHDTISAVWMSATSLISIPALCGRARPESPDVAKKMTELQSTCPVGGTTFHSQFLLSHVTPFGRAAVSTVTS